MTSPLSGISGGANNSRKKKTQETDDKKKNVREHWAFIHQNCQTNIRFTRNGQVMILFCGHIHLPLE